MKYIVIICALLSAGILLAADAQEAPAPAKGPIARTSYGEVQLFPSDYPMNQPIADADVHTDSDTFIRSIGPARPLRAGFGYREHDGSPLGIRIFTIPADQKKLKVNFGVNDQDMVDYPIPDEVLTLKGSFNDCCLILDPTNKKLYELYALRKEQEAWKAYSGLCFDLTSAKPREAGKKGGCSSGLPILAGLVRVEEVKAGRIKHALLFTLKKTQKAWISPATAFASQETNEDLPPLGLRLRLNKDFDTSKLPKTAQVIAEALKKYGMLVASNGMDMQLWGEASDWWKEEDMDRLKQIKAADFEAVDTGPIVNR